MPKARGIIERKSEQINRMADLLLEKETIYAEDIERILGPAAQVPREDDDPEKGCRRRRRRCRVRNGGCAAGRSDSRDRNDAGRRCRKCVGNENRRFGSRERRKIRTQVTDESNPLIYLMSEKMKNLMVRTLSGAVLAVVVLGAVIWSQWSFGALLLAMLVAGMLEFYGLAEKQGNAPQKIVGMAGRHRAFRA